jgi:hypothetical protein
MSVRRLLRALALVPALLALTSTPLLADPPTVHYRLVEGGAYEEGCFDPCMCPVFWAAEVEGAFGLTRTGQDGSSRTFAVSDVDWYVPVLDRHLVGSGTYQVELGGERRHRMILDLEVDGGAVERFDSGLVPREVPFPRIALVLPEEDLYCYGRVVQVSASPRRPRPHLSVATGAVSWDPVDDAWAYDLIVGDLGELEAGFPSAAMGCLADDVYDTSVPVSMTPALGEGLFFVARAPGSALWETYDANGVGQVDSRDTPLEVATGSCP